MAMISDSIKLPCGAVLKNRIAKAAMTEGLADTRNRATPRLATLYARWAKGGAGLLITGNVIVDRRYLERPGNVAIDGPISAEEKRALCEWSQGATSNGAGIWMQLSHAGRQTPAYVAAEPVGPSAVQVKLPGGQFGKPRALNADEIDSVIARFAEAAATAKQTGFTGVQIHAAHGYLISEFLNPLANRRDDEWGGSVENRARLLLKTVRATRAKVGSGFPISVKLNSSDFQKGGYSFADCLQIVDWLDAEGIDLLEISGGSYEQPMMMGLGGVLEPVVEAHAKASTIAREAYFLDYAAKVATAAKTPVMVTGGFRTRAAMNAALEANAADVIGLARPFCVEPDIARALLTGAVAAAPSYEKSVRLGPGFLSMDSPMTLIKTINGFGVMAFFYDNLYRLADGLETKKTTALLPAFLKHQAQEKRAAKALVR